MKIFSFKALAFLLGCLIVFLVVKTAVYLLDDSQKLLSEYLIGSHLDDLGKYEKILFEYDGPLKATSFTAKGYSPSDRELLKGEKLIVIDRGEWIIFLYYDSKNILIEKSISGS